MRRSAMWFHSGSNTATSLMVTTAHGKSPETAARPSTAIVIREPTNSSVIASNNDGVWNETGAALSFTGSLPPGIRQIRSVFFARYFLFCIAWTLYQLRVRQLAATLSARFDERLAERTRLARELHDTLIQTIQGSKMVADDALDGAADPVRMRRALERLSEWLAKAMQEGREALGSLRTSTTRRNDLAEGFQRATEDCPGSGWLDGHCRLRRGRRERTAPHRA